MRYFLKINNDNTFTFPLNEQQLLVEYPDYNLDSFLKGNDDVKIYQLFYEEDEVSDKRNIFQKVKDSEPELVENNDFKYYVIKKILIDFTEQEMQEANNNMWVNVRNYRNTLLAESDWIVIKSLEKNNLLPNEWLNYRQDLRDITNQSNPFNITWPSKPN